MSRRKKSRHSDIDYDEYERSRPKKRTYSSSPEPEIKKHSTKKKTNDGYKDSHYDKKRYDEYYEETNDGYKDSHYDKKRYDEYYEDRSKYKNSRESYEKSREEKRSRRKGNEGYEDMTRSSNREEKDFRARRDERETRSYRDIRESRHSYNSKKYDKYLRHEDDRPKENGRYWNNDQVEHSDAKQSNNEVQNKNSKHENDRLIGQRYYGESPKDSSRSGKNSFEDKENQRTKEKRLVVEDGRNHNDLGQNINRTPQGDSNSSVQGTVPPPQRKTVDLLTSRTGGAYIPPAKLRMLQAQITDKSSAAYQRIAWEALKKSIHGHINKVNTGNIAVIVRQLLKENIVRGRGLLCRSIVQAQAASPTFTSVYAALVAVINSKFPNIGELLLRRLVLQFRRGFKRNDKTICISSATFIAHLVNQRVAHEIVALEILTLLIETPTDDSVEVAISFLKECGMKLMTVSKKGIDAIFEMLRNILHEGQLDKRVQYMIEVIFQIRKDEFRDHKDIIKDLDLVEENDQFTHLIMLDEAKDAEDILNVFKFDPEYEANEEKYTSLRREILDEGSSGSESGSDGEDDSETEEDSENEENKDGTIIDNTETNLVALRRTIYLTIHSSLDFEECAHKLMRMELKPGQEIELCHMFLDCCAEQRTYEKFFGLLAQRFCEINKIFIPPFQQIFKDTYDTIHRLDTNKLRNVAKFFAHLLFTDAISWEVLSFIHLNEEETTSSSRIFIKILFHELSEYMTLTKLNERVKDPTLQVAFDGLFPRDDPKNTRFAINFFTSIGLGGLTDDLREHLKTQPKTAIVPNLLVNLQSDSSDTDSSESSSDDSSTEDSSSFDSDDSGNDNNTKAKSKHSKKGKKHKSNSKHKKKKKVRQKEIKKKKNR